MQLAKEEPQVCYLPTDPCRSSDHLKGPAQPHSLRHLQGGGTILSEHYQIYPSTIRLSY